MVSRLKGLVSRRVLCAALMMTALVSGWRGAAARWILDWVFAGNVFSGSHLKPKDYPIHGIDVSKFQGDIDWNAVANSGVKFAGLRRPRAATATRASRRIGRGPRPPASPMAPITSSIGAARRSRKSTTSNRMRRSRTTRSRRCLTSKRRRPRRLAIAISPKGLIADMQVMLQEMERHYRKRPIIYTTLDFYEAILSDGALADVPILGALDQTPSCREVRLARLAFLAVPIRRPGPGHRRRRRQGRFLRHKGAVGRFPEGAGARPAQWPQGPRPPLRLSRLRPRSRRN